MKSVSDPKKLRVAWNQQYARLAEKFSAILPPKKGVIVDVGCGKGQFTIPLARKVPMYKIIALDRFTGPYSGNRTELSSAIAFSRMKARIEVVVSDCDAWLTSQQDSKYDGIISSEFLPEIDSKGMRHFFTECYRVLKSSGFTIHSFLAAQPRNVRQKRLIEADADPKWTKTPPSEWFSPPRKLVLDYLKLAGFRKLYQVRLESSLVVRSKAARELLKDWDIRQSYWKSHHEALEKEGLEIPDWLIISGIKQS